MGSTFRWSRRGWFGVGLAGLVASVGAAGLGGWGASEGDSSPAAGRVRIGVYDSRAVAIAYGRSEHHARSLEDLMARHKAAKDAKDSRTVKSLEAEGEGRQIRMHLQAFSTAPIDDCLDAVRASLPEVAQRAQVVAIFRAADYHDESVELVDVTDELARLFNPDAKTLEIIAQTRKQAPAAIEEIARMPANK